MSLIAGISIGAAIFVVAYVLLLSSSSIGGNPNERLLYALSEQTNNQSISIK
jgi:hypothetical protein